MPAPRVWDYMQAQTDQRNIFGERIRDLPHEGSVIQVNSIPCVVSGGDIYSVIVYPLGCVTSYVFNRAELRDILGFRTVLSA